MLFQVMVYTAFTFLSPKALCREWVTEKKNMPPAFSPEHICPMNLVYSNTTEDNIQDFHIVLQSQLLVLQLQLQFETQYIKSL